MCFVFKVKEIKANKPCVFDNDPFWNFEI